MAKVMTDESNYSAIVSQIRSKLRVSTRYKPSEMAAAIRSISGVSSSDNGKVVVDGQLTQQTSRSVSQNGTYDTTTNDEVVVNVSGGGVSSDWNETWSINWDFSDPSNSKGMSSYTSTANIVYSIDGWQLQGGVMDVVSGGIKLRRYSSSTAGFFMQRYKANPTAAMVGKEFTLSILVDDSLGSSTFTMPSSGNGTLPEISGGVGFRVYNYGTEVAVTIDISDTMGAELIKAIKLERGSRQTLATLVNGTYVLNNSMDKDLAYMQARDSNVVYSQ